MEKRLAPRPWVNSFFFVLVPRVCANGSFFPFPFQPIQGSFILLEFLEHIEICF